MKALGASLALLALLALGSLLALASATNYVPPPSLSAQAGFNPRGKTHATPKSSYHARQGLARDTRREYPGQSTSHERLAEHPREVDAKLGQHLFQEDVYEQMVELARSALGDASLLPSRAAAASGVPEQIKLSITSRPGEMVVSWVSWSPYTNATVQYGLAPNQYSWSASGRSMQWVDPNSLHLVRYVHCVLLTNLQASTTYSYRVGDPSNLVWSDDLRMRTVSDGSKVMTLGLYGDLGLVNARTMQAISREVAQGDIDLIIHSGDYGYNIDELQGLTGDVFFNELQNITSLIPYMGSPGNHEQAFNFSHYANKFALYNYIPDPAGKPDQLWWHSYDISSGGARVHIMSLNSELYYWDYLKSGLHIGEFQRMIQTQWNWIQQDLIQAYDSGKYDWIFAYAHRPLYCSNTDDIPDCTHDAEKLRSGYAGQWGWEKALGVRPIDLYISAHEHSYERTMPVWWNGTIDRSQSDPNVLVDPQYPVHLIAGAAGCREYFDYFDTVFYGPWSVVRSATYGYGRLRVHNATHLQWQQLLDEGDGGVDEMWIVKKNNARRAQQPTKLVDDKDEQLVSPVFDDADGRIALS